MVALAVAADRYPPLDAAVIGSIAATSPSDCTLTSIRRSTGWYWTLPAAPPNGTVPTSRPLAASTIVSLPPTLFDTNTVPVWGSKAIPSGKAPVPVLFELEDVTATRAGRVVLEGLRADLG